MFGRVGPLAVALAAILLLAGCAGLPQSSKEPGRAVPRSGSGLPSGVTIPDDWFELAVAGNHPHNDIKLHQNLSTPNFSILGNNPLYTDYHGKSAGGYFCSNTQERDGRRLSIVHSFVSDVVLLISDVTDAAHPEKLGELVMAHTQVYDLALSPDLRFAALATSPLDGGPDSLPTLPPVRTMTFRDACTGEERPVAGPEQGVPYASGTVLVDISNPRNPVIADFRPLPAGGAHSVRIHEINGKNIVLTTPLNPPVGYAALFEIQSVGNGPKMVPLSAYVPYVQNPPEGAPGVTYVHDAYISKHPGTGAWLMYLAHGTVGLEIVNVDDLRNPRFVSHFADWSKVKGAQTGGHFVHEALPMTELWDGRHYTFIGEECGGRPAAAPTCLVTTLDTTDPTKPQFIGAWTLPTDVSWTGTYQFSTHYIAYANGTLFITTYHGGVWAVDVSTEEARRTMPSVGVFIPAIPSPKPWPGFQGGSTLLRVLFANVQADSTPLVLDLDALPDGTLVVYDGSTGLYVVDYDESIRAPSPPPWPLGYNEA